MKKFLSKITALVLACLMTVGATACSSNTASLSKADSSKTTTKTKLQVMSWWDITKSKSLQQLKEKFEAANPDIELEFTMIGSNYGDKIFTILAGGGNVPDVMMLAMDLIPKFAKADRILPLDQYITQDYKDSLYPNVLKALTVDGKVYGVARDVSPMVMYLNTDLFKASNVEIPKDTWTVDDFIETAKKLTKNGQWGYYFPKYADTMYDWMVMNGARYVSEDGTKSLISSPEAQASLQFMYDLIYKYKICPTEAQVKQFGDKQASAFVAGKVAMQIGALSMSDTLTSNDPPINYTILPLPSYNGKKFTHTFVNSWTIPKGAKHPDLSWKVLKFFSGKEGQQIALDYGMGLPANKSVDTTAFIQKNPANKYFIDALNYATPFETSQYGSQYNTVMQKDLEPLWLGKTTVKDATANIDRDTADILAGK